MAPTTSNEDRTQDCGHAMPSGKACERAKNHDGAHSRLAGWSPDRRPLLETAPAKVG